MNELTYYMNRILKLLLTTTVLLLFIIGKAQEEDGPSDGGGTMAPNGKSYLMDCSGYSPENPLVDYWRAWFTITSGYCESNNYYIEYYFEGTTTRNDSRQYSGGAPLIDFGEFECCDLVGSSGNTCDCEWAYNSSTNTLEIDCQSCSGGEYD